MYSFKKRFFCVSLLISSLVCNSHAMESNLNYGISDYSLASIKNCETICKDCGYKYYDCVDDNGPFQGSWKPLTGSCECYNCFKERCDIWFGNKRVVKQRPDFISKLFLLYDGKKEYKNVVFRLYSDVIMSLERKIQEGKNEANNLQEEAQHKFEKATEFGKMADKLADDLEKAKKMRDEAVQLYTDTRCLMDKREAKYSMIEKIEFELMRSKRPWFHKFRECYINDSTHYIPVSVFLDWCIGLFGEVKLYEDKKGEHIVNFAVENLFMEATNKSKKTFDQYLWKPFIDFNNVRSSSSSDKETQYHILAKFLYDYVFPFVRNDRNLSTGKEDITRKLLCLIINKSEQYRGIGEIIEKLKSVKNSFYGSIENDFLKLPEDRQLESPSYEDK